MAENYQHQAFVTSLQDMAYKLSEELGIRKYILLDTWKSTVGFH